MWQIFGPPPGLAVGVGQVLKSARVLDDRADGGKAGLGQAVRAQCDGTHPGVAHGGQELDLLAGVRSQAQNSRAGASGFSVSLGQPGPRPNGESFPRSGSKKCAGQDSNPRPAA
jgi:hypothetical protein